MGKTPDRFRKTNTLQLLSTPVSMLYLLHQTRQISHIQQRVRRGGMFFKKKEKKNDEVSVADNVGKKGEYSTQKK